MESILKDSFSHVNDSIQSDTLIKKCLLKNVDKLCNDAAKLSSFHEKNLQSCGKSLREKSLVLTKYASALFVKQSELGNAILQLKRSGIKYRNNDKKLCLINININTFTYSFVIISTFIANFCRIFSKFKLTNP